MGKVDVSKLSIEDLVIYEKALKPIILKYENTIKNYDGSMNTNSADYIRYEKFNKIYLKILEETERRILESWEN